jgi:hypothetical protein
VDVEAGVKGAPVGLAACGWLKIFDMIVPKMVMILPLEERVRETEVGLT